MGVGVEAPGRDHHSTASSTEQGYNMANGYSSDDQRGGTAESYQGEDHPHQGGAKTIHVTNPNSASAASTHSPAELEEKMCSEGGMSSQNQKHIKENGIQSPLKNNAEINSSPPSGRHTLPNSTMKFEDCNSSKESIAVDVESTQPEDIKPFTDTEKIDVSCDTKPQNLPQIQSEVLSATTSAAIKPDTGQTSEVDWSLYHLDDMTLAVWLQAVRKHVLMPLKRHPRSETFLHPVDPVALGIFPFYNQIISHPMDLGTVKDNIEKEIYVNKSSCLQDINQVWLNAKKFNPNTHAVHSCAELLQKQMFYMLDNLVKSGGITGKKYLPTVAPIPPPMRNVGIREARKRPVLPGEYDDVKPQHLEQKYASKLSEPLKQCDTIMRNLMLQAQHWDYVEPFMKPVTAGKGQVNKMSLALINERLRCYYYSNALEFATDMRRIVTETYKDAIEPIEEDFRAQKARLLHAEFEKQFARVMDDEGPETGGMSKIAIMQDPYISKLLKAQEILNNINNDMASIADDVVSFMTKKRERRKQKMLLRQNKAKINNRSVIDPYSPPLPPNKRQRISPGNDHALGGIHPLNNVSTPVRARTANAEQIGEWIQNLDPSGQEQLLEVLKCNGENIQVDEEGEVELSLENWSEKTLADVELYLRQKLNQPIHSIPSIHIPNTPIVQQFKGLPNIYNQPRPQSTMPEPPTTSHFPNIGAQMQRLPSSIDKSNRKSTGGKHLISKANPPCDQYVSDSSSDGSESSNSSDDESSSSADNSSDEN